VRHQGIEPSDAKPMALAAITDTGRGMNASELARAFDPFFTTREGGTGLGLPVCLEIMTRHQGAIRLESQPGAGTTALLTLPLRSL
jgi:signal transduction histidine kinase